MFLNCYVPCVLHVCPILRHLSAMVWHLVLAPYQFMGPFLVFHSKASDTLNKEIEMFEKFLKRLDPKDVQFKGKLSHMFYL